MDNAKHSGGGSQTPATSYSHPVMEFVNLFGTPKHNKEKAKAVRSHVMKIVRKKQSESSSRSKSLPLLPLSKKITATKIISKEKKDFETDDNSPQIQPALALIKDWVERGGAFGSQDGLDSSAGDFSPQLSTCGGDPRNLETFNLTPTPFTPRLNELLHFTARSGAHIAGYSDSTHTCVTGVGDNPALLTIAMNRASECIAQGTKSEELESALYLELVLKSITCALANASIHGIEDSTIAAVATLSSMENLNGNKERALIHIQGLQSLVAMKGGVDALAMNETLRRLVLWADLCNATRWQSAPVFPLISLPTLPSITQFMPKAIPDLHLCLYDSIINTAILSGYSDLLQLLQDFHTIVKFLEFVDPKDTALLQDIAFVDHVYIAEHKNLVLMARFNSTSPSLLPVEMNPKQTLVLPLLFQALMLYVYTNIRLTPVGGSIRSTLVGRIHVTIAELPVPMLDVLFEVFPHELFWIMFLAGSSSVEVTQRLYFISHLKWMCESLALICWEDVEGKLRQFLWIHKDFLYRCMELWTEIASYIPDDRDSDTIID